MSLLAMIISLKDVGIVKNGGITLKLARNSNVKFLSIIYGLAA